MRELQQHQAPDFSSKYFDCCSSLLIINLFFKFLLKFSIRFFCLVRYRLNSSFLPAFDLQYRIVTIL